MFRAGVVGIGHWGRKVAREYLTLVKEEKLESVVLCDADASSLRGFIDECRTVNHLDELFKEVDMIHVCTPNSTHYEIARKALEMNLNVLIEKPMAENVNHAFELAELSMKNGKVLQVGHIFRFANVVKTIKQLYEAGAFGKPYYLNLEWTHQMQPMKNVDVIYDLLPHPLDIIHFISGKWPVSFSGIGKPFRRSGLLEAAFIEMVYDEFFANIHLSWVTHARRRKLEIIGSKASLHADCANQTAKMYEGSEVKEIDIVPNNTIRDEILNFIRSVETGKNDYNSCIIGARCVDMLDQAIKSVKNTEFLDNNIILPKMNAVLGLKEAQ